MAKLQVFLAFFFIAFALTDGAIAAKKIVGMYEIKKGDFSVKITNWGATVMSVVLPDSKGNLDDIVLGFDTVPPYVNDTTYFGAIVGRVANRIGHAQFTLNGKRYKLFANEKNNTLHGGHRGFSKVIWTVVDHKKGGKSPYIKLHYHSFDGEQGFPGDVDVYVTYQIVGDYHMRITMMAKSLNKPTPVNLAHHSYWNLAGQSSGNILSNTIQLFAASYTPVDKDLLPTGQILPVKGTPYDFTTPKTIGSRIQQTPFGYDFNYVLDAPFGSNGLRKAAILEDSKTRRKLELWTNQPGLQFYTSNQLDDVRGKDGYVYGIYDGVCLESQGFPDSVNHPNFPSQILNPGKIYKHEMLYKFSF